MSRMRNVVVVLLTLMLLALLALGACTKEVIKEVPVEKVVEKEVIQEVPVEKVVEVPVEPKVVKIGGLWDFTGPAAASHRGIVQGYKDYVQYVNEDLGGIDGVKVELDLPDTKYELALCIEGYERMQADQDLITLSSGNSAFTDAMKGRFAEDEIPYLEGHAGGRGLWPSPDYHYCYSIGYGDALAVFIDWALENWDKDRPMRIASLFIDHPMGWGMNNGGYQYARARGVEIVEATPFPVMAVDLSSELRVIQQKEPDWLIANAIHFNLPVIIKGAQAVGFKAPIAFPVLGLFGPFVISKYGAVGNGIVMTRLHAVPRYLPEEEMTEGRNKALEFFQRYNPQGDLADDETYYYGFCQARLICEAIRLTIEEVGVEGLNRETLNEYGYKRVKDLDMWDISPPLNYSSDDYRFTQAVQMAKIEDELVHGLGWVSNPPFVTAEGCVKSEHVAPGTWEEKGVKGIR